MTVKHCTMLGSGRHCRCIIFAKLVPVSLAPRKPIWGPGRLPSACPGGRAQRAGGVTLHGLESLCLSSHPPVWASRLAAPDHCLSVHLRGGLMFCDIFFPLDYFVHPPTMSQNTELGADVECQELSQGVVRIQPSWTSSQVGFGHLALVGFPRL